MRAALTERLGLKATALLIAVLLWLVVSARQPVQEYVQVRVLPTLDSSLVLLEEPPMLKALVSGRAVDIVKLRAYPPAVHRIVEADVPDTLVVQVSPSDVRMPADLADNVHVLDVQPRSISLRFGDKATKRVKVIVGFDRVVIAPAVQMYDEFALESDPALVRVTGPRQLVRRITGLRPYSLTITNRDSVSIADLDTTGVGVRVMPSRVRIRVKCLKGVAGTPCPA